LRVAILPVFSSASAAIGGDSSSSTERIDLLFPASRSCLVAEGLRGPRAPRFGPPEALVAIWLAAHADRASGKLTSAAIRAQFSRTRRSWGFIRVCGSSASARMRTPISIPSPQRRLVYRWPPLLVAPRSCI
jgi:hypothetical protein